MNDNNTNPETGILDDARLENLNKNIINIEENEIISFLILIPFSISGALIRIKLRDVFNFVDSEIYSLIYAQLIGCFIMGFCLRYRQIIVNLYSPLYIGLTSGLCGSITTFSSWNIDIFQSLTNTKNPNYNVMNGITQIIITICVSMWCIYVWIADFEIKNTYKTTKIRKWKKIDIFITLLSLIILIIILILVIIYKSYITIVCITAPLGSFMRFYLSRFNIKIPKFPIGTFLANIIGTLIISFLKYKNNDITNGFSDGLCGCLTTISTFAVELVTLYRLHSFIYATISVFLAQCIVFIVLGTYIWTNN